MIPLEREGGQRGLVRKGATLTALASRLYCLRSGCEKPLAGVKEPRFDDRIRVEHQDGVPHKWTRELEPGLPGRGAAGFLILAALEYGRPEAARDVGGSVGASVGDDHHRVARSAVRLDRGETVRDEQLLVVRGNQNQKADRLVVSRVRLAIEERGEGQRS